MDAIHRCFEPGESVKSVSEDIGYTRAGIYNWCKKYPQRGTTTLINNKNIKPDTLKEGSIAPVPELVQLQAQIKDMQMEIDILKGTTNVLKKDPRIDQTVLKNRDKSVIIDTLRNKYLLPALLRHLSLSQEATIITKNGNE